MLRNTTIIPYLLYGVRPRKTYIYIYVYIKTNGKSSATLSLYKLNVSNFQLTRDISWKKTVEFARKTRMNRMPQRWFLYINKQNKRWVRVSCIILSGNKVLSNNKTIVFLKSRESSEWRWLKKDRCGIFSEKLFSSSSFG